MATKRKGRGHVDQGVNKIISLSQAAAWGGGFRGEFRRGDDARRRGKDD